MCIDSYKSASVNFKSPNHHVLYLFMKKWRSNLGSLVFDAMASVSEEQEVNVYNIMLQRTGLARILKGVVLQVQQDAAG